jgi:WD40 repeat protein
VSRIFLSHSSTDNAAAMALADWLAASGWTDVFLDLDPERGIAAGELWKRRLYEAADRCEAVLFLVTPAWLASEWCKREFELAAKLNKRAFILLFGTHIDDVIAAIGGATQATDLHGGTDHRVFIAKLPDGSEVPVTFSAAGLARLKAGLERAGLDPRHFAWPPEHDPNRSPFPGLRPFGEDDAGIFFGREGPIISVLDRLRGLREAGGTAVLAILAASGAGKSSFLRAGILSRLRRDDANFQPLPVVRPEHAVLSGPTGLISALETALAAAGAGQARADIRAALAGGAEALADVLRKVASARPGGDTNARPLTPVLIVDQAEELFTGTGSEETNAFLELIARLSEARIDLIVIFGIRSDAYARLQTAPQLAPISLAIHNLPPLPIGAYKSVIEGPLRVAAQSRRAVELEPALLDGLLADLAEGRGSDALPLLAFTLERLLAEFGGRGRLTLADYSALGGIGGVIDAAVQSAFVRADADANIPRSQSSRMALLKRALIPWLAGIDVATGSPRRRIAKRSEIPVEALPLVQHLVDARLLTADSDPQTGETTLEPSHEALLRQWSLLAGWLREDFAALATLDALAVSAGQWESNARHDDWLEHRAGRLEDAEALPSHTDFAPLVTPSMRDYLAACRRREDAERDRALAEAQALAEQRGRVVQRTTAGLVVAVVLLVVAGIAGYLAFDRARDAEAQKLVAQAEKQRAVELQQQAERQEAVAVANESMGLGGLARFAAATDDYADAVMLALAAWPREGDVDRPKLKATASALSDGLKFMRERLRLRSDTPGWALHAAMSPDRTMIASAWDGGPARLWDAATGELRHVIGDASDPAWSLIFASDSRQLILGHRSGKLDAWDTQTGTLLYELPSRESGVSEMMLSPDGRYLVAAGVVIDLATRRQLAFSDNERYWAADAAFSADSKRIAIRALDGAARLVTLATGIATDEYPVEAVDPYTRSTSFSDHGIAMLRDGRILMGYDFAKLGLWDGSGEPTVVHTCESNIMPNFAGASLANRIVVLCGSQVFIYDATTLAEVRNMALALAAGESAAGIKPPVVSPDGRLFLVPRDSGQVEVFATADGRSRRLISGHDRHTTSASFSSDSRRVITSSADGTVRTWDISQPQPAKTLVMSDQGLTRGHYTADGSRVLVETGRSIELVSVGDYARSSLKAETIATMGAAISDDGSIIASYRLMGGAVDILDATGNVLRSMGDRPWSAHTLDLSADGQRVAVGYADRTIRLWDTQTGDLIWTFDGGQGVMNNITFSPDGSRIAATSLGSIIHVLDAKSGAVLTEFDKSTSSVQAMSFSPDGSRIASFDGNGEGRIWDPATGQTYGLMHADGDYFWALAYSPDGQRIAAGADDAIVIFDAATGSALRAFYVDDWVTSLDFSPDGKTLLSGGFDGTLHFWDVGIVETGDAFEIACGRLGRTVDLTALAQAYGLAELPPICGPGHRPVAAADLLATPD